MPTLLLLLLLSIAVATTTWTITNEDIFKTFRRNCAHLADRPDLPIVWRKLCYIFTCGYCLSHWMTVVWFLVFMESWRLIDWPSRLVYAFVVIAVANVWMTGYALLRTKLKRERTEAEMSQRSLERW